MEVSPYASETQKVTGDKNAKIARER